MWRFALAGVIGLGLAGPVAAQGVGARALAQYARKADSTRIRMLEARADSLTERADSLSARVAMLNGQLAEILQGIERATDGKTDKSGDDLWRVIRKLIDRVCHGDRTDCP